jgi:MFS transporter, MHS family, proline/betaine transporter
MNPKPGVTPKQVQSVGTKAPADGAASKKAVLVGTFGNIMEWYDWAVYGYFAPVISKLFFPAGDRIASLLLTFAVFAIGFVVRPLGALFFGSVSDRLGRKTSLMFTVFLMGLATFMIGVLPTYAQIGIWAPVLLILARLLQGLSAGGEWGSSTSFIVEYAPRGKRGLAGSWLEFGSGVSLLLGSLIAAGLNSTLSEQDLYSWGWRLPFIGGVLVGIVGWYLRVRMKDTPFFEGLKQADKVPERPLMDAFRKYPLQLLKTIGFTMHWTVSYYLLLTYMPTYLSEVLKLPFSTSLIVNSVMLAFFSLLIPLVGWLSDRYGRKPLLLGSSIGLAVTVYSLFHLMDDGMIMLLVSQLLLAIFCALYNGPAPTTLAELFPTQVRASALSVGYNVAVATFGGTAPFIATYLVSLTHNPLAPTFYVIGSALVTTLVLLRIKETYQTELE